MSGGFEPAHLRIRPRNRLQALCIAQPGTPHCLLEHACGVVEHACEHRTLQHVSTMQRKIDVDAGSAHGGHRVLMAQE
ncbi:hypothetical protein [Xanthomonas melonis]|uniref:hypothetical protein n=1 Tax=Xanthomonas melonis TaxID=56456 RepID=UPI003CCD4852